MGQTSRGFLTVFFTLVLPLLLFLNLLAFGHLFGFDAIQRDGDVYVGFSSFINSISLLEQIMNEFDLGLFSAYKIQKITGDFLNALMFGFPRFISQFLRHDFWSRFDLTKTFDLTTFPIPDFSFGGGNDILTIFQSLVSFFNNCLDYAYDCLSWFTEALGSWYVVCYIPVAFFYAIGSVVLYASYLLALTFYFAMILILWLYKLFNGEIFQPMPSVNNSSWQDVAEDWTDYWQSQNALLPPLIACL